MTDVPVSQEAREAEESYKIGVEEGRQEMVREIDLATGGDGEFWHSTLPGRGCPDDEAMKARVIERFQQAERDVIARMEGWRPIETAPKDGTEIDVWINGEFPGRRTDVSWRKPTDSEWWVHGGDTIETPDATWHDCFGPLGSWEQPTHWMPLPPAPEAGQ